MQYINERPIVADDDHDRVLKTSINQDWAERFLSGKHNTSKVPKTLKRIRTLHKTFTKGKPKVPLKRAEKLVRNVARRYAMDQRGARGANFPARRGQEDIINVDEKYNPLDPGTNNEKPLDPRTALDPVMQALRKRKKERLQRATHGDAPPIFPDPMDAEMNEDSNEEMFPKLRDIPKLTQGLSKAQKDIWNRAMNKPSSARKDWRSPRQARRLAKRLADSVLYEDKYEGIERRAGGSRRRGGARSSPNLIKAPRYGERGATRQVRTVAGAGSLTGSDSYRPKSQHATLVKHEPRRMLEKLRGLIASWRTKAGKPRQVVKNIPIRPKFGTSRLKKYNPLDKSKWGKKTESDLKK